MAVAIVVAGTVAAGLAGCGQSHQSAASSTTATTVAGSTAPGTAAPISTPTTAPTTAAPTTRAPTTAAPATAAPATATPSTGGGSGQLTGKVITLDPGHNGANYTDTAYINALQWNGRENEACNTTGTQTDAGYTEALFNWNVAQYAAADLRARGAQVILTRSSNDGVGPCNNQRVAIGNDAHSDAVVAIHADGGPASGRGFAILEPVADGPNDGVIASSQVLGADLRSAFVAGTGEPVADYYGTDGIQPRDDLAGVNLTTVPKVFIECGNMRNATDAALLTTAAWQMEAGQAIAGGITTFVLSS